MDVAGPEGQVVRYRSEDPIQNLKLRVRVWAPQADPMGSPLGSPVTPAAAAAGGAGQAVPPLDLALTARAEPGEEAAPLEFDVSWQQKVFSREEVAALKDWSPRSGRAAALQLTPRGQERAKSVAASEALKMRYHKELTKPGGLLESGFLGSEVFTYVDADAFHDYTTLEKSTTSRRGNKRLTQARKNSQVIMKDAVKYKTMHVMLDSSRTEQDPEGGPAAPEDREEVVCAIRAYANGSFEMKPGFSGQDARYRLETKSGAIYEYTIENISQTPTELEKRQAKVAREAMERADLMRKGLQGTSFIPLPLQEPGAIKFSFFGEVLAGRDFGGRNVYCEYHVEADREVWRAEEGFGDRLAGVSPAARAVAYPQAWGLGQRAHAVAHWCFPIELAMVAAQRPKPSQWPILHFHVASIDGWERHRTEGYGSLLLGQHGPGQRVQYIPTWRPAGTVFSRMAEFYVGGAHALKDITYAWNNSAQAGSARLLSKYGFQAETSGTIKVRTNMVYQERPDALQAVAEEGRKFSTDEIIQRARRRIQEKPPPAVDPPTIVRQPRAVQTLPGETVTLAVEARGALPLRYQWSFNGRKLPGATRDELVLPAVEDSVTGAYQCRVTGPAGSVLTDEVDVHILTATTIVEHPRSQAAAAGDVAVFTVVVGGEPPIRYQWTHNGEAIPDARDSTLRVGPVARTDAGFYGCMASGPSGKALSNQAELTILKKTGIVRHPRPMQVFIGEPAEFAVEADGAPPLRFQWSKDGADVPGGTAATLRIASSREEDSGVYACRVTGPNGAAASAGAELQILTKVTILTQPVSQSVAAGAAAEFSIKARAGNREPMYQWSKNGEKIPGASASVYRIRAAAGRDEGIYTCRVTGTAASVLSDEAELILLSGTSITRHPESLALAEGATAAFRVAAQGTGDLAYQWAHDGKEIAGATQAAYSVPASPAAAGTYTCTVTSGAGKAFSNDAELTLLARQGPTIVAQPQDAAREQGQSASFSVKAVGDGPLGYEWKKGGAVLPDRGPEITVDDVQEGFTVTCRVTNAHGEAVSRAALLRIVTTDIFELLENYEKANQTRMFDLFRQFDKDGSGQLDIDELAALVRTVHPGVTPAQLRHFQILIDADGDGRLSYKEMVMGVKECKQAGIRSGEGVTEEDAFETLLQKVGQVLTENNARAYEIFEALDADDSGRLGPQEVRTLFKRLLPGLAKKELRALLVRLYASGGVEFGVELEYAQFRTWMVQRETGEVRSELTRRSGLRTTPREAADQARSLIG